MPRRFQNVLQNFKAGVLSPRMSARVDFEAYNNSLKTGKNWIITPQGGAQFRQGLRYLGRPPSNQPFRIFQFRRGGDYADILLEVSAGITRYWIQDPITGEVGLYTNDTTLLVDEVDEAFLLDEADDYNLAVGVAADVNPYSVEDLESLYFTNEAGFACICHANHPPMIVTLYTDGSLLTIPIARVRIPQFRYPDLKNPAWSATKADWQITVPESWYTDLPVYRVSYNNVTGAAAVGDRLLTYQWQVTGLLNAGDIKTGLDAAAVRQGFLGVTFVVDEITPVGTGQPTSFSVTVTGTDAGWIPKIIEVTGAIAGDALLLTNPVTAPFGEGSSIEEEAWSYPTWVTHTPAGGSEHYYKCLDVHESTATTEPGVVGEENVWGQYWEDVGTAKPEGFDYQYPNGNAWVGVTAPVTVYAPKDRGFPTVALFNDQRLLLMANRDNPTAIYGSGIGEILNFLVGPEDNDPFIFVLDSTDSPIIRWARSQQNIIIGTSGGDWVVGGGEGNTITPTSIRAIQQNFSRSHLSVPVQVDDEIFYIEMGQRKVRSSRFVDEFKALNSADVSVLAEHLISTDTINRIIATFIPETFLQMLRVTGQPVFMTYDKTMGVMAYCEMETDAFVYDMCGYFSFFERDDASIYAVQRNGEYVLETMRYPKGKYEPDLAAANICHLDSYRLGTVDGQVISGLDNLNGLEVHVLIDDAWLIKTNIVVAGQIALNKDYTGSSYAVGILYDGYMETFEPNQNPDGNTALGTKRRWNALTTRLLNSALPEVYTQRGEDRTPSTLMNEPETIREGLQDVRQNVSGYGDGSIVVIMDRPYPTQIVGFFGEYQVEDR